MVRRQAAFWLDILEAVVIIMVLLAISYLVFMALAQAWAPVFRILGEF